MNNISSNCLEKRVLKNAMFFFESFFVQIAIIWFVALEALFGLCVSLLSVNFSVLRDDI